MGRCSSWIAVLALALSAGFVGCGGNAESRESRAAGGTAGAAGSGGGAAFDISNCFRLVLGQALVADVDPFFNFVNIDSWIGSQRSNTYLGLSNPALGIFDLSTPENRSWSVCTQCVSALRGDTMQIYQAQSGTIELTEVDGMSSGRLLNVVLREVTIDANREATIVEGGACLVAEDAGWQTAPCEVGGTCPGDMECLGSYYSTFAACAPRGDHALGESCTYMSPSTDCAEGLACTDVCSPTCSFWSANTCPTERFCNADSRCIGPLEDAQALGESCPYANRYCGAEEGRYAGMCVERGAGILCERLCRTDHDDCGAGETCAPLYEGERFGSCTG